MKKQIHHIMAKTPLLLRVVSLYVLIGFIVGASLHMITPTRMLDPIVAEAVMHTVVTEQAPAAPVVVSGVPVEISITRIGLVKEVIGGDYDRITQQWALSNDKAHYATMTVPINNASGQTVIYGHNTSAVLEPVKDVLAQDELRITADSGKVFIYTYSHDRFVDPTDASVLYENPETPRVVLMTCEGWLSLTRRLLYFDFKEIQ